MTVDTSWRARLLYALSHGPANLASVIGYLADDYGREKVPRAPKPHSCDCEFCEREEYEDDWEDGDEEKFDAAVAEATEWLGRAAKESEAIGQIIRDERPGYFTRTAAGAAFIGVKPTTVAA